MGPRDRALYFSFTLEPRKCIIDLGLNKEKETL